MRYYIIAGEASGDLHGSNLMRGLYEKDPEAVIRFWGGELMDGVYKAHQAPDGGLVEDYKNGAVIGFSQVILHFGDYAGKFRRCCSDILSFKPDAVVLIDYPGFNFRVAEFAHKEGLKVFYYIAPKVWASREGRIKKLRKAVDHLFIVFPFEKKYFEGKGIPFSYSGNPLVDAVDASEGMNIPREEFLSSQSLPADTRYIALLAGSRKGEVASMMPVFVDFCRMMHETPGYENYKFLIGGAPSRSMEDYSAFLSGKDDYIRVLFGQTYAILRHGDAAVINSGTASLEACLIGCPQVVAYAGNNFNFRIGKLIIRVDNISLGNLILGRKAFRELIQYFFTPRNVYNEVRRLLEDKEYRQNMLSDYAEIRSLLGGGGASRNVAESMIRVLKGN